MVDWLIHWLRYSRNAPGFSREQSAKVTFTDCHNQDFSLLAPTFFCPRPLFHTPLHPTSKALPFLIPCGRSKENHSIPGDTQQHLRTHPLAHKIFVPWIHIRNNKIKSYTHLASRVLKLYQVHKDEISAGPTQNFLPQATTTHPPAIRALQNAKTTTLGLLSLCHWFLTEDSLYQHRRANYILLSRETISGRWNGTVVC